MEEKRRDAGTLPAGVATSEPQSADSASTRRRAGAQKRKASALNASGSSSAPSKRVTREKSSISHAQIHNGPLTRARQGPGGLASASLAALKSEEKKAAQEVLEAEEARRASEQWEALEAAIEADFEAVRSRNADVHVVPNHCGWFSWTKVHPLEERALASFFNGKSQSRTHGMYLEIRNKIMKKFRANPKSLIELKDLEDLEVGDLEARQEVFEFLDYWGLINFHPFLPSDSLKTDADVIGIAKEDPLVEKLYRFEATQPCLPIAPRNNQAAPPMPSGLFSESAIAEDLVKPEGPSVEYHCNSCSADCSRKRYHCQKQADFDLCTDCFNSGKFGSGMSSSDFILMEPAELHGVIGGNWTDQETLLLLEALELYKENWSEIAEHVATKSKAQCILHFLQMPIQDAFLDCDDDVDATSKENTDLTTTNDDVPISRDTPERTEGKTDPVEDQPQTSPMDISKAEDTHEGTVDEKTSTQEEANKSKVAQDIPQLEDTEVEVKDIQENLALKALREAFEALGYSSTPESSLSFAEVGNPVMALAGFLARLVGSDVAAASAHRSLKSVSGSSPGLQLVMRHCFILEEPPDHEELAGSQRLVKETGDVAPENDTHKEQKEDMILSITSEEGLNNGEKCENNDHPAAEDNVEAAKELDSTVQQVKHSDLNVDSSDLPKNSESGVMKDSNDLASDKELPPSSAPSQENDKCGDPSHSPNVDLVNDSVPSEMAAQPESSSAGVTSSSQEVSRSNDVGHEHPISNDDGRPVTSNEIEQLDKSAATESSLPKDKTKDLSDSETTGTKQSHSVVEIGSNGKKGDHEHAATKYDSMDKLKRAAASALSAAAVKAKLLADREVDQIRHLAILLAEKQLHKVEMKLAFYNEVENVTMRVREQLERARQRLYHERAQIIAARLGYSGSSSRPNPASLPTSRIPMNMVNLAPRAPTSMPSQRPPLLRPSGNVAPNSSNPFVSTSTAGG
ncbi:SWI/SNF complex subunit SWI3D isoform X2 [Rhodamnia argentea]|uniref:SWI/SNF complex subunit SWI3D isoform X2 n=1 Tax=Rhodamnia argentea TaxID=178133 RepID=A0ABM3GX01_9MYRT|nr:SWI/SNF complex subunit SWI3D isoform X2 [Rhodamnia argentea]